MKDKLTTLERDLHGQMSKQLVQGIESVRHIQKENKIPGVYGPLIELVCGKFFGIVDN